MPLKLTIESKIRIHFANNLVPLAVTEMIPLALQNKLSSQQIEDPLIARQSQELRFISWLRSKSESTSGTYR